MSSPTGTPIYEQLVREWAASDRTLPGLPDMEWSRLARYSALSGGEPEGRHGPPTPRRGWLHDRHPV